MYELKTTQFTGPLDALLTLIESRKLEITQLNLAEVTVDFLNYVKTLPSVEPQLLVEFLEVATQLILIKSRALLPSLQLSPEEETSTHELEARLKFYQEFRTAERSVQRLWVGKSVSFSRALFLGRPPIFYPPEKISAEDFLHVVEVFAGELQRLLPLPTETSRATLVSIEEKIQELIGRIHGGAALYFERFTKDKPKTEVIAVFLALLHLLKERLVSIEQEDLFSDIIIRK